MQTIALGQSRVHAPHDETFEIDRNNYTVVDRKRTKTYWVDFKHIKISERRNNAGKNAKEALFTHSHL